MPRSANQPCAISSAKRAGRAQCAAVVKADAYGTGLEQADRGEVHAPRGVPRTPAGGLTVPGGTPSLPPAARLTGSKPLVAKEIEAISRT